MITIEEIDGQKMTVVWHNLNYDYIAEFDNEQPLHTGEVIISDKGFNHIATALPALPRYPKPETDYGKEAIVLLAAEYRAKGISLYGVSKYTRTPSDITLDLIKYGFLPIHVYSIDRATYNGKRVEIAIKENDNA